MAKDNYIINTSPKTRWNQTLNIKANLPFARKKRKMNNPTPIFFFLSLFPFHFYLFTLVLSLFSSQKKSFYSSFLLPLWIANPSSEPIFCLPETGQNQKTKALPFMHKKKQKENFISSLFPLSAALS